MGVLISKRVLKIVAVGWTRRKNKACVAILETALFGISLSVEIFSNI